MTRVQGMEVRRGIKGVFTDAEKECGNLHLCPGVADAVDDHQAEQGVSHGMEPCPRALHGARATDEGLAGMGMAPRSPGQPRLPEQEGGDGEAQQRVVADQGRQLPEQDIFAGVVREVPDPREQPQRPEGRDHQQQPPDEEPSFRSRRRIDEFLIGVVWAGHAALPKKKPRRAGASYGRDYRKLRASGSTAAPRC